ncbi:hypothetical protein EUX98_g6999 [Antrodiella citrinella]|uniref:RRM domain-containing protein n=1 Tax=Antrodiella citrinella TaxID=2447956 RepID=A0A4S4MV19_9APHY|nr:hypothetical protein EUX98_g6999 [Antrodiella citrinella]
MQDHDTALSAVRNLNGQEIGGRPLRIDLADSDPFLEGKTTIRGELIDAGETRAQWREREREREFGGGGSSSGTSGRGGHGGGGSGRYPGAKNDANAFLAKLPRGVQIPPGSSALDSISALLARENPSQILEVLAQMKVGLTSQSDYLLCIRERLGYALFQALLLNKIVDPTILNRMLAATASSSNPPPQQHTPAPQQQQHFAPPPPVHHPQPGYGAHPVPPPHLSNQPVGGTPPNAMYPPPHQNPHMPPPAQLPPYYGRPPPGMGAPPPQQQQAMPPPQQQQQAAPQIPNAMGYDAAQRDMLAQVLALTQDQINSLPAMERDQIIQLAVNVNMKLGCLATVDIKKT